MAPGGTLAAQPFRGPLALPALCPWAPLQFPCSGPLTLPVSCSREGLDPPFWAQTVEEMAPNATIKGTDMDMKVDLVYSHYAMLC